MTGCIILIQKPRFACPLLLSLSLSLNIFVLYTYSTQSIKEYNMMMRVRLVRFPPNRPDRRQRKREKESQEPRAAYRYNVLIAFPLRCVRVLLRIQGPLSARREPHTPALFKSLYLFFLSLFLWDTIFAFMSKLFRHSPQWLDRDGE